MKRNILFSIFFMVISAMALVSCSQEKLADNIVISSSELYVVKGQTAQLNAEVLPYGVPVENPVWSADNGNVTVDTEGKVTGVELGSSIVTFSANGLSANCHVEVVPDAIYPETIKIVPSTLTINHDMYAQLEYAVTPKNATHTHVTWKSEDESIIKVDQKGYVHAMGEGSTKITATSDNGVSGVCIVKVEKKIVQQIYLYFVGMQPGVGDMECQYIKKILPEDATDKSMTWTSTDSNVITVEWDEEDQKAILTAKAEGKADIVCTSVSNPAVSATCWVEVMPSTPIPFKFGFDWVLIDAYFVPEGQDQFIKPAEYATYLQQEGLTEEDALQRIDMLERYVSVKINSQNTRKYLILTLTTEDGTQYTGNSTSFEQLREGNDISQFVAHYDLSAAPQEIQDMFSDPTYIFSFPASDRFWTYDVYYEQYGVGVRYVFKGAGESILDKK